MNCQVAAVTKYGKQFQKNVLKKIQIDYDVLNTVTSFKASDINP